MSEIPDGCLYLYEPEAYGEGGRWFSVNDDGNGVPYVPEARALDAERERDKYRLTFNHASQEWHKDVATLRAQLAAVTAEREALVPLARLGLWARDAEPGPTQDHFLMLDHAQWLGLIDRAGVDTPATTLARAILGRVP